MSTELIIGIAAGGGAALVVILVIIICCCCCCYQKRHREESYNIGPTVTARYTLNITHQFVLFAGLGTGMLTIPMMLGQGMLLAEVVCVLVPVGVTV